MLLLITALYCGIVFTVTNVISYILNFIFIFICLRQSRQSADFNSVIYLFTIVLTSTIAKFAILAARLIFLVPLIHSQHTSQFAAHINIGVCFGYIFISDVAPHASDFALLSQFFKRHLLAN